MKYHVHLTLNAQQDLEEIYDYIMTNDSAESALKVMHKIAEHVNALEQFPERGSHPWDVVQMGIKNYRVINMKPYRIFYRIKGNDVYVGLIADGRRSLTQLFLRRLTAEE